jgi:hypothetical protein
VAVTRLWNYRTGQLDLNVTVTDANALDYLPQREDHTMENRYWLRRAQGEQPDQAIDQIWATHHVWG